MRRRAAMFWTAATALFLSRLLYGGERAADRIVQRADGVLLLRMQTVGHRAQPQFAQKWRRSGLRAEPMDRGRHSEADADREPRVGPDVPLVGALSALE